MAQSPAHWGVTGLGLASEINYLVENWLGRQDAQPNFSALRNGGKPRSTSLKSIDLLHLPETGASDIVTDRHSTSATIWPRIWRASKAHFSSYRLG